MAVCNTCVIFGLMHAVDSNKQQQCTKANWSFSFFFFLILNSDVVRPEPNQLCGAEDKWAVTAEHLTPPVMLSRAAEALIFPPDPISSIGSWQQLPPQRKTTPFVLQPGKDLQGPGVDKWALAVAAAAPLWRDSVGCKPRLAPRGFPGCR